MCAGLPGAVTSQLEDTARWPAAFWGPNSPAEERTPQGTGEGPRRIRLLLQVSAQLRAELWLNPPELAPGDGGGCWARSPLRWALAKAGAGRPRGLWVVIHCHCTC